MEEGTRVNTATTRSTDLGSIPGLTCVSTKVCGSVESNTALVFILCQARTQRAAYGRMEKELNGSMQHKSRVSWLVNMIMASISLNQRVS
jgi:hypothetical protein